MSILGTKYGDAYLLGCITGVNNPTKMHLHLFSNNHTPGYDDAIGVYTELSVGGYSITDLLFSAGTITTADPFSYLQWPSILFTFTGSCLPYGYFISDSGDTVILAAELFLPTPPSYGSTGGPLNIQVEIGLQ